jgi:hypothetical protein
MYNTDSIFKDLNDRIDDILGIINGLRIMCQIEELVLGLRHFEEMAQDNVHPYTHLDFDMRPDFPQPEHYIEMFKKWRIDV